MSAHMDIVKLYINAYNSFNIDTMLSLFTSDCIFEDISNSRGVNRYEGIDKLKEVALQSKNYFTTREQKIVNTVVAVDKIALEIEYHAILALDLPNGLKKGDSINLRGVSIFEFKNNKIARLADYS